MIGKGRAADLLLTGSLVTADEALLGADHFGLVAATDDLREGTRAFREKAAPSFGGR